MTRRPRVAAPEIIAALEKAGFSVVRVRGSHHRLTHADGRVTTVPIHGSDVIGPGLLSKIIRDCDLTWEQFEALLKC